MVGERKEEDIVGRLEALRKKVPPPSVEKPKKQPKGGSDGEPDEKRKKLARVIGILVIIIVLGAVFLLGSKFFLTPEGPQTTQSPQTTTAPGTTDAEKQAAIAELAKAKSDKVNEVNEAFSGLPVEYVSEKDALIQAVKTSTTKEDVNKVDIETSAANDWRAYRKDEVVKISTTTEGITARVGDEWVKGADDIKNKIERVTLSDLKIMIIKEMRSEFIPIRLPRDRITGGFAEIGDGVNIHYRWTETVNGTVVAHIKYLVNDGRIVTIMKPTGTISLSESEQQSQSGGGTEGKGNVTTITLGGTSIAISDGPYGASVGYKQLQKSTTYSVDLAEIQKAAAASKIDPDSFMENMEKYGAKLTEIERETNIGDFNSEYLMLIEVSEDEAGELAMRLLNQDEKANLLVTISKTPSWAK